jgi:hypothetical protein
MKIQEYIFNTKLSKKQLLIFPVILIVLFTSGIVGGQLDSSIIFIPLAISYALVALSFVLTRNIVFPLGLFLSYNTIILIIQGNVHDFGIHFGSTLIQLLFIVLVFTLVNHFDKKPDTKVSRLDFISIAIITILLTVSSVFLIN